MTADTFEGQTAEVGQEEQSTGEVDPAILQAANDLWTLGIVRRILEFESYPREAREVDEIAGRLRKELEESPDGARLLAEQARAEAARPRGVIAIYPKPSARPPRRY